MVKCPEVHRSIITVCLPTGADGLGILIISCSNPCSVHFYGLSISAKHVM